MNRRRGRGSAAGPRSPEPDAAITAPGRDRAPGTDAPARGLCDVRIRGETQDPIEHLADPPHVVRHHPPSELVANVLPEVLEVLPGQDHACEAAAGAHPGPSPRCRRLGGHGPTS